MSRQRNDWIIGAGYYARRNTSSGIIADAIGAIHAVRDTTDAACVA
ncbi:MAG: hypothetical protein Q8M01_02340 [Rubrivivax sp.]|nr:hypothetical protein [Rubrivivax sp.]